MSLVAAALDAHADAGSFSWTRARGADACPSHSHVVEELTNALGRPVETALEGRALDAVIEHAADGWTVTLYWRAADGTPAGTRVLHDASASCDAPSRTAITSILVALGADAITASSNPPAASSPPPAESSAPPPTPLPPVVRPILPPPTAFTTGDVTLGGLLSVNWLPVPAYGVQLVAEPLVYGRLRIAVVASALAEVTATFGAVQTGFAAAEFGVDGCGTVLHVASWVEGILCGGLRAGVVQAFVYSGLMSSGGAQGSFAAEGMAMVRLTPVGPAVVEVGSIGRLNITQYSLRSPGNPPVYTQSIGAFVLTIRLGVHF